MSSQTAEYGDLQKQIGCMNGILQLFDRQHFLTNRHKKSSHDQKRLLLQGVHYQMDPECAKKAIKERDLRRQKENSRISSESSRASYSSSSSSTFSSHDYNRSAQREAARDINSERTMQIKPRKEQQPPFNDLRNEEEVSKGGEALELSFKSKSQAFDGRRSNSIKHVDSPRPVHSFQSEMQKSTVYERSDRTLVKVQEYRKISKEERALLPSRFSYDGIELQGQLKSNTKHKEIPRLSLDSKASFGKCSGNQSKLDHDSSLPGTHSRSSSIVTKLMGLDVFPDYSLPVESNTPTVKSCYNEALLSQFTSKTGERKQNQVARSPRVSQNDPTTPSRQSHDANSQKKSTSPTIPVERAPTQGIPKKSLQTKNDQSNLQDKAFSVYGEIEKRITELEFRKSDKNLRALKQILDTMHKTKETTDKRGETGESMLQTRSRSEQSRSDQNSNIPAWKNRRSYYLPKQQSETRDPELGRVSRSSYLAPKTNNRDSKNPPTSNKKANQKSSEPGRTLAITQHMKAANGTTSSKSLVTVGLRLQQNKLGRQERPRTPSSDSSWPEKHSHKKLVEVNHLNKKNQAKNTSLQLSYQGDTASVKSESNNSILSQTDSEIAGLAFSTNVHVKQKRESESAEKQRLAVEISTTMQEQPSPVSVLDDTFYSEDSPSRVKRTSRSFREDETPTSAEAECHYKDITSCGRSDSGYMSNQKIDLKSSALQRVSIIGTGETVGRQKALAYDTMNPDHTYVNKIFVALGVVKESSFIPTTDHLDSSSHLINPEMFHILEQTEAMEKEKAHRKIIFDVVNEILVRKIYSGRLHIGEKRSMSTQSLLKEVYLEIDRICKVQKSNCTDDEDQTTKLLTADMVHKSEDWANDSSDIQGLILDIERLIFKDLINEIVIGEILALHNRPKKHCRQLFRN